MKDKVLGLIYGAFIGDALSLGPHWIYDTSEIRRYYKPITGYTDPEHTLYHDTKEAGDLTHYGDQSLVLLKSICDNKCFSLSDFKGRWMDLVKKNDMYMDHASKESLSLLESRDTGSSSGELGGFSRSAPMFLLQDLDRTVFEHTMIEQVNMTHNDELLSAVSIYFTRVIQNILAGRSIRESLAQDSSLHPFIYDAYEKALVNETDIISSIKSIGQSCSVKYGLPGILTILLKVETLEEALIENCYAGGDSASRGMVLGMVYGARDGFHKLPKKLIETLNQVSVIQAALDEFYEQF